jgi:hypothetical protein
MSFLAVTLTYFVATAPEKAPSLLERLEDSAEAAYEDADQGAWEKVAADVTGFTDAWETYREAAHHLDPSWGQAVSNAKAGLEQAVEAQDGMAVRVAANTLSHLLAPWVDDVKGWPGLAELDPLEREVAISADQGAWERARHAAKGARKVFLILPCGRKLRSGIRKSLDEQDHAVSSKDVEALKTAESTLEDWVDKLERACAHWRPPKVAPASE